MDTLEGKYHREDFKEASYFWDLESLYDDLGRIKGKKLSPTEKLHLRGLLCGYSPTDMAKKLYKNVRGIESDLSETIYDYIKKLVNRENQRMDNWRNVSEWLQKDYKMNLSNNEDTEEKTKNTVEIPVDSLNGLIKINKINHISNQGVVFEINIRVVATVPNETKDTKKDI